MKIATIGTGSIVDQFMDACTKNSIEIVAMYSRKKESAYYLSNKYNIKKIFTNLNDMLCLDEIDFIYIASPNSLHYEHTKISLENHKHVLCEKPFTSTYNELFELTNIAKENKLFLFEAITTLHLPHLTEIKKQLDMIGPIHMVQCNFSKYSSRYNDFLQGTNPNIFNPHFSGGALVDLNVYNLHFVTSLFGFPISSKYQAVLESNGIDTTGIATLIYNDKIITCTASKNSESPCISVIQGEKGYIQMDSVGGLHDVKIITKHQTSTMNLQNDKNNLYYELAVFKEIFNKQDFDYCYNLLLHSNQLLQLLEKLRKDANIIFSADKE